MPAAPRKKTSSTPTLLAPAEWKGIHRVAVAADGRVFAGENGHARVCAWSPDGALAWETTLQYEGDRLGLHVQLFGELLLVFVAWGSRAFYLDPKTGAVQKTIGLPQFTRTLAVSPDGSRLVVRTSTNAKVFALPEFRELATLEQYCNEDNIAFSDDSARFAINGHEVHVFDTASATHEATFAPPGSPNAMIFDRDGAIVTGDGTSRVGRYDVRGTELGAFDAAPEKKGRAKPTIMALAATPAHLAAARKDGTVVVFDRAGAIVATHKGHAIEQPGGRDLGGLAFSPDGTRLFVGATKKGTPVGVSIYPA